MVFANETVPPTEWIPWVQYGALGILGFGVVVLFPGVAYYTYMFVNRLMDKHEATIKANNEANQKAIEEVCKTFTQETEKCRQERVEDRARFDDRWDALLKWFEEQREKDRLSRHEGNTILQKACAIVEMNLDEIRARNRDAENKKVRQ